MTCFLDLFAGIGGFSLGAYWAGLRFDAHYFSEVDPYAIRVYQQRFPDAVPLGDIRNIRGTDLPAAEWIIAGGFPCQPHSLAGLRKAERDERDLWPECARMLRELQPRYAVFENVRGLFTSDGGRFFNGVLSNISECGYDAEWQIISASSVGAPHKRERVWIVAHPSQVGCGTRRTRGPDSSGEGKHERAFQTMAYASGERRGEARQLRQDESKERTIRSGENVSDSERIYDDNAGHGTSEIFRERPEEAGIQRSVAGWWISEPGMGRMANGISNQMDRLKCLGNSIVPQIAELIFSQAAFDEWRTVE